MNRLKRQTIAMNMKKAKKKTQRVSRRTAISSKMRVKRN
jgi:hypothetical protein